jgi:hypothetical protein
MEVIASTIKFENMLISRSMTKITVVKKICDDTTP